MSIPPLTSTRAAILGVLVDGKARYGLNIAEMADVQRNSLYVLLRRLQGAGYLTSKLVSRPQGGAYRYYKITREGIDAYTAYMKP